MASKKQRRRKRQRAAAKAKEAQDKVNNNTQTWYTYLVATRVAAKKGPVQVRTIKEFDEEELIPFIKRLIEIKELDELDVFDIHRENKDGTVEVLAELADWPPGVGTMRIKGEFVRGMKNDTLHLRSDKSAGKATTDKKEPENKKDTVIVPPVVQFKTLPMKWYTIGTLKA